MVERLVLLDALRIHNAFVEARETSALATFLGVGYVEEEVYDRVWFRSTETEEQKEEREKYDRKEAYERHEHMEKAAEFYEIMAVLLREGEQKTKLELDQKYAGDEA